MNDFSYIPTMSPSCLRYAGHVSKLRDIPSVLVEAFQASTSGRPGAAYVGLPSNVLLERLTPQGPASLDQILSVHVPVTAGEAGVFKLAC